MNNNENEKENLIIRVVLGTIVAIFLMLGPYIKSDNSSTDTIDMRQVGDVAENYDKSITENIRLTQKEKYEKHYQNGIYFEDLSKYQDELNQKFKEYYTTKAYEYIKENNIDKSNWDFFFTSNIEFINQDVKKYAQGELKAEDIILNPDSIMSMESYFIKILDFEKYSIEYEEHESRGEITGLNKLNKYLYEIYMQRYEDKGIDFYNQRYTTYNKSLLERYTLEELRNTKDINTVLSTLEEEDYLEDRKLTIQGLKGLRKKYNKEFYKTDDRGISAPKDNPDLYFQAHYLWEYEERSDLFLGLMYQYELNKYLQKMVDEVGLTDRVVFLVTTKSYGEEEGNKYGTNLQPYNFGEGYNPLEFIKNGYFGNVNITLIYLKNKEDKKIDYESLQELVYKIDELVKIGWHSIVRGKDGQKKDSNGDSTVEYGTRKVYVYYYDIDDYGRKVIIDLFKKYPLTEHSSDKRVLGLADIYSLSQITRAETPGFHYIDIFATTAEYYDEFNKDLSEYIYEDTGSIFYIRKEE